MRTRQNPFLILVALAAGFGLSYFRYSFTAPPDDLWFQVRVIENSRPVIVKFGAEWCGPCRAMESELTQVRRNYGSKVDVIEIDVDDKPHLARHYSVSSIPHTFVFSGGKLKSSHVGFATDDEMLGWVRRYMN